MKSILWAMVSMLVALTVACGTGGQAAGDDETAGAVAPCAEKLGTVTATAPLKITDNKSGVEYPASLVGGGEKNFKLNDEVRFCFGFGEPPVIKSARKVTPSQAADASTD